MNRHLLLVATTLIGTLNLSWSQSPRLGLLTDSFGIVTTEDLDAEEARCTEFEPFPAKNLCFNYWQCLPTRNFSIECENLGKLDGHESIAEATFRIENNGQTHLYGTRRNFDIDTCEDLLMEWREIVRNEEIVCISGTYDGSEQSQHYWTIDRMKSLHGEWSYFTHEKDQQTPEQPPRTLPEPLPDSPKHRSILTSEDLELEAKDRSKGPALSSLPGDPDSWESYNRWFCFDTSDVSIERIEISYDGKTKLMPQLNVDRPGHLFEIALSGETEYDNDEIEIPWKSLLKRSPSVCVYAAYLQGTGDPCGPCPG